MSYQNLADIFNKAAREHSGNVAVSYINEQDEEKHLTYEELDNMAVKISWFLGELQTSTTIIAVYSRQTPSLIALLLGILKARAAFAPIGLDWTPTMAEQFLKSMNLNVKVVVVDEGLLNKFNTILSHLNKHCDEKIEKVRKQTLLSSGFVLYAKREEFKSENFFHNFAYVMQTSGTTGSPKTVRVPHQCIVSNITSLTSIFNVCCNDCVALISPYTFDPFIVQLFVGLSSGTAVGIISENTKLQPGKLCKFLFERLKTTIFQPTPSLVYTMGHKYMKKLLSPFSTLRVLAFGGEPCPSKSILQEWKHQNCTTKIFNLYGITEVSSWASCYEITIDENCPGQDMVNMVDVEARCAVNSIPIGLPLDDTRIEVWDNEGNKIDEGFGTIHIGGEKRVCFIDQESKPQIMRSTGDLGYIHNGQIWYYGRQNRQIKRMGKHLNLEWLEQTLSKEIPNHIFTAAITEVTKSIPGNKLYLFVKPPSSVCGNELSSLVQNTLLNLLPYYAHPDNVCIVDNIPMTSHGKVDSKKLLNDHKRDGKRPDVPLHEYLKTLWSTNIRSNPTISQASIANEVNSNDDNSKLSYKEQNSLETKEKYVNVKDEDKFVENGGTSLDAIRMAEEIELLCTEKMGSSFEFPDLLDIILNETFGNFCKYIEMKLLFSTEETEVASIAASKASSSSILYTNNVKFNPLVSSTSKNMDSPNYSAVKNHLNFMPPRKRLRENKPAFSGVEDMTCFCSIQRGNCLTRCPLHSHTNSRDGKPFSMKDNHKNVEIILDLCWKVDFHKCIDASPLVVGVSDLKTTTVFLGSHAYIFKAVRLFDGKVLWEVRVGDRIESSAAISICGCFIIVGCYNGKIYVFNRNNGVVVWTFQTGGQVKSSPCVDPSTGLIWVGSHDHHLYSLDICNHSCTASFDCGASCFSSPDFLPSHKLVFITTLSGRILSVCTSEMIIKWTRHCPKPIFASPLVTTHGVLCGCVDGTMYFYSLKGLLQWQFKVSGPIFSSPSVFLSNVVFGSHDKYVYCISNAGQMRWKFMADSEVYSTSFVTFLNVTSEETTDRRSSLEDHSIFQSCSVNNIPSKSHPTSKDAIVVACSTSGTLYCLSLDTGRVLKTWSLPGQVFSSPVIVNNMILVGCRDDYLYCINIIYTQQKNKGVL